MLHIPQPFLNNPEHFGGMRLGFGAADMKAVTFFTAQPVAVEHLLQGEERKKRLEKILAHIVEIQGVSASFRQAVQLLLQLLEVSTWQSQGALASGMQRF